MTKWSDEHLAMAVELVITQGKSNAIAAGLITRATGIHRTKDSVIGILNRNGHGLSPEDIQRRYGTRSNTGQLKRKKTQACLAAGVPKAETAPLPKAGVPDAGIRKLLDADLHVVPPSTAQALLIVVDGKLCENPAMHDRACRWPFGDPARNATCFCAQQTVPSSSYCEEHTRLATGVPPAAKREPVAVGLPISETPVSGKPRVMERAF